MPENMYEAGRSVFVPEGDKEAEAQFDQEYDALVESMGADGALKFMADAVREADPELYRSIMLKAEERMRETTREAHGHQADSGPEKETRY
jgi:cysteine synthase